VDFIGRETELERLKGRLDGIRRTGRGDFIAMRGRRRVGKSRLVEEFAQRSGCPYIFYTAVQGSSGDELARFLDAVAESDAPASELVQGGARASTWEAALELAVRDVAKERPLILVVDEFPYLVEEDASIEAVLQAVWDRTVQKLPAMLILIGSDVATMAALTKERRPLYDRPREMVVRPLTPADIGDMLGLPPAEALDAYLVIGGFPVLALEWGKDRSLADYLADALDDASSFLVVSGERALAAEFPVTAYPRLILNAIGGDARANKDLLQRTGMNGKTLADALGLLVEKGVVERLLPYSAKPSPKTKQYVVADPYMHFWLGFIGPNIDLIERGRGRLLAERARDAFPTYRGRAVESIVRDAIERLLPSEQYGNARYVGGYWTRNHAVEVDLIGGDKSPIANSISFVGSVKWRADDRLTRADAAALAGQRPNVPGADASTKLLGVSREGFDEDTSLDLKLGPEDIVSAYRDDAA